MSRNASTIRRTPPGHRGFAKAVRQYSGAQFSRLTSDWLTAGTSADAEVRVAIDTMRKRARDLERNNDYVRRFLGCAESNIVGSEGVRMQSRVTNPDGKPDTLANERIESGWREFCKRQNLTSSRLYSMTALEKLIVRTVARDGEIFIRMVKGRRGDKFGITLVPMEGDFVDHLYNRPAGEGLAKIEMGVEIDEWGAPVAYWTFPKHPGDLYGGYGQGVRTRHPASEFIHIFLPDRLHQHRGISWLSSAMIRLRMLGAYEEAELISARAEACKLPVITTPYMEGGVQGGDGEDEQGNPVDDFEPGMTVELPYGKEIHSYDPTHPNGNYEGFRKGVLRGIAAGLGVGYNTLAQDLEGVNYSSLRAGFLDEREVWKSLQSWLIESFHEQLFPVWLEMALLSGVVNLPPSKIDKFNSPVWRGRRWPWVDPLKDIMAAKMAIALRLKSRRQIISESEGADSLDVFSEFAQDESEAESVGISLPDPGSEFTVNQGKEAANAEAEDSGEDAKEDEAEADSDEEGDDAEMDRAILEVLMRQQARKKQMKRAA